MGKGKRTMIHKILQRKLKIEQHKPEFRSLSEFYIIIFLNQLKIDELPSPPQREQLKIRTYMAKAKGSLRDSHDPFWFSELRTDVPTEPPSPHIPCNTNPTKTGAELRGSRRYDGLEFA
jgi:hypothetical protein